MSRPQPRRRRRRGPGGRAGSGAPETGWPGWTEGASISARPLARRPSPRDLPPYVGARSPPVPCEQQLYEDAEPPGLDMDLSPSRHRTKVRLLLDPGPVAAAEPGNHSPCSGDAARQTEQTEVLR